MANTLTGRHEDRSPVRGLVGPERAGSRVGLSHDIGACCSVSGPAKSAIGVPFFDSADEHRLTPIAARHCLVPKKDRIRGRWPRPDRRRQLRVGERSDHRGRGLAVRRASHRPWIGSATRMKPWARHATGRATTTGSRASRTGTGFKRNPSASTAVPQAQLRREADRCIRAKNACPTRRDSSPQPAVVVPISATLASQEISDC